MPQLTDLTGLPKSQASDPLVLKVLDNFDEHFTKMDALTDAAEDAIVNVIPDDLPPFLRGMFGAQIVANLVNRVYRSYPEGDRRGLAFLQLIGNLTND